MADGKRTPGGVGAAQKIAVATPNIGGAVNTVPLDVALAGCVGARVRLTTVLQSAFEGTIFTADPLTNLIAITTTSPPPTPASSSQTPLPGDYRVIPISKLQSFQLLALAPDSSASTTTSPSQDAGNVDASSALKRIDWNALKARERAAVEKELKKKHSRGPGVGKEAQDIFDALSRTLDVRWHEQNIVVLDSVMIRPPYGPEDCKALGKETMALQRVKKVLEMEKRKVVERHNSSRNAAPTGASNPSGAAPPVSLSTVPALPATSPSSASQQQPPLSNMVATPVPVAVPVPAPPPAAVVRSAAPVSAPAPVAVPVPAVVGMRKGG